MDICEYRNDFIKKSNQSINYWFDLFDDPARFTYDDLKNYDKLLLKFLFCIIQISNIDKIKNFNLPNDLIVDFSRAHYTIEQGNTSYTNFAHSLFILTKELKLGETFSIPSSTFNMFSFNQVERNKPFNINDWEISAENDKVSIDGINISSKKKGRTIIYIKNKINQSHSFKIRILSGNIKETESDYILQQMRNVFDHGKFYIRDTNRKCAINSIEQYGYDKDIVLLEENQLNISFDGGNCIGVNFVEYITDSLYMNLNPKFKNCFDILSDPRKLRSNKDDFIVMLLLSKFYVNFIYQLDFNDKHNFDYNQLSISHSQLSNSEYIYAIRTAISHGWYLYTKNKIIFLNYPKSDINSKPLIIKLTIDDFKKLILEKETLFNKSLDDNLIK